MEVQLANLIMQYGLAGLAVYLMYKLMCNHVKSMTDILCKKLSELTTEIRELRQAIMEKEAD